MRHLIVMAGLRAGHPRLCFNHSSRPVQFRVIGGRAKTIFAAMAIVPAHRQGLVPWNIAASGLAAGYIIGWPVRFGLRYQASAPREALTPR